MGWDTLIAGLLVAAAAAWLAWVAVHSWRRTSAGCACGSTTCRVNAIDENRRSPTARPLVRLNVGTRPHKDEAPE